MKGIILNKIACFLFAGVVFAGSARAGPESQPMKITRLRPYMGGTSTDMGAIFLDMSSSAFCGTSVFKIDTNLGNSKQAYAAALAAMLTGRNVIIEVDACNGWASTIRSIYVES